MLELGIQWSLEHPPDHHDPGVVDQHVDAAQLLFNLVQEGGEGGGVTHIEFEPEPTVGPCTLRSEGGVEITYRNLRASRRQGTSGRRANALRATSDRDDLATDTHPSRPSRL